MADSMAQGAKEFGRGIFQGVTGVVMEVSERFVVSAVCFVFFAHRGGTAKTG